jgi:hypothetical protein
MDPIETGKLLYCRVRALRCSAAQQGRAGLGVHVDLELLSAPPVVVRPALYAVRDGPKYAVDHARSVSPVRTDPPRL